jgi:LDH2 family malate/lactate/ureidoglycolate dehydrogenase
MQFDITYIRHQSEKELIDRGLSGQEAALLVDTMIAADMNGISTHGIRMLPAYIQKIERNEFSFETPMLIKQFPAFSIIDAKNTIGAISANYATDIAIEQARESGIHTAFCRNANTFGAGFYYAEKIASSGMIGFICSNSPAAMPAFNGLEALLGTNPIAFAVPTRTGENISIDMATSVVAKSKFGIAKANGAQFKAIAIAQAPKPT